MCLQKHIKKHNLLFTCAKTGNSISKIKASKKKNKTTVKQTTKKKQ